MSSATIKHSLATVKTELEFLNDSNVITEALYEKILDALPPRYQQGMEPYDVDRLGVPSGNNASAPSPAPTAVSNASANYDARSVPPPRQSSVAKITEELNNTTIGAAPGAPPQPPRKSEPKPLGYCKALFEYAGQEPEDLSLHKDDKLAVVEHLSEDWWKGYKQQDGLGKTGIFPSNYVNVISQQEFEVAQSPSVNRAVPPPPQAEPKFDEKSTYSPTAYSAPAPPQYDPYQSPAPQPQAMQPQPSYGGYAQYPPPSTNYYPPQQYQPQPQPQQPQPQNTVVEQAPQDQSFMRKAGGKFGNAAIFGAGATLGGDLVNSIF